MIVRIEHSYFINLKNQPYFYVDFEADSFGSDIGGVFIGCQTKSYFVAKKKPKRWADDLAEYLGKCFMNGCEYVDIVDLCHNLPPESLYRLAEK